MILDLFTTSALTAVVCNVAGAVFIIETLLRRDDGAGRVWSVAFLAGMATTIAYGMWAAGIGGFVSVAIGNALFVSTTGCMWLGSRRFNQRPLLIPGAVVIGVALVVAAAAALEGPEGGDWAGWLPMGIALLVFAALASVESARAPMIRIPTSWALVVVLAVQALYYVARTIVFVVAGPESAFFQTYFSTNVTSLLTVALTIVAVVVASVLRAGQADLRAYSWMTTNGVTSDGILESTTFHVALADISERAGWRREIVCVTAVRVDDLPQIATAFGVETAGAVERAWRQGVRRYAPSTSLVGEDGATGLVVASVCESAADARRQASVVYRGLFDRLGEVTGAVIPLVGVGVALSETVGYDPQVLIEAARRAAGQSAANPEASITFGGTAEVAERLRD